MGTNNKQVNVTGIEEVAYIAENSEISCQFLSSSYTDIYVNANAVKIFGGCSALKLNLLDMPFNFSLALNMYQSFKECKSITGSPFCPSGTTQLAEAFYNCYQLTGNGVCGDNVTNMLNTYLGCTNLNGIGYLGPKVTTFTTTFKGCNKLTGFDLSAPTLTSFYATACGGKTVTDLSNINYIKFNTGAINLASAFAEGINLTGQVDVSVADTVTSMASTFKNCSNMQIQPVVGNSVTSLASTYFGCTNIYGNGLSSPVATTMASTYEGCTNLNGIGYLGPKVTTFSNTFKGCNILTGFDLSASAASFYATACGGKTITDLSNIKSIKFNTGAVTMTSAFAEAPSLGQVDISIADTVTGMASTFLNCSNLKTQPVCGSSVTAFQTAYCNCYNIYGDAVCGPQVTNMSKSYYNCVNLDGTAYVGPKVTNCVQGFYQCNNLTGIYYDRTGVFDWYTSAFGGLTATNSSKITNITFGPNCISVANVLQNAKTIGQANIKCDSTQLTSMSRTFQYCSNLNTPNIICPDTVTDFYAAYCNCFNLYAQPVVGSSVNSMAWAYGHGFNLYGDAVSGPNVTNMYQSYFNCYNLDGTAFIGPKVTNYVNTFYNCTNLTGFYYDKAGVTTANAHKTMFGSTSLAKINKITFGQNCTNANAIFRDAKTLQNVSVSNLGAITDIAYLFTNCTNLKMDQLFFPSGVTLAQAAYQGCSNLTCAPACGSAATIISYLFQDCTNLSGKIILPSTITNMYAAFRNTTKVTDVVVMANTANVVLAFNRNVFTTRLNIIVNNRNMYNNIRLATCTGATPSADATYSGPDLVVNSQSFKPVRYSYNAARNVYIYGLT